MKFSIYKSVRSPRGAECTYERFIAAQSDPELKKLCAQIADEEDDDRRGELKKGLPIVTWQAYFKGKRLAKEAEPSGLFMLDIDHVENPGKLYSEKMCGEGWKQLHGVVFVAMTASRHGLRVVAKCRPEFSTIEENQRWLASELGVEYDAVCKDWARSSFITPAEYNYYMDAAGIWDSEAETRYDTEAPAQPNTSMEEALFNGNFNYEESTDDIDQREGLFGGEEEYRGLKYSDIITEWWQRTGGEPVKGDRNAKLFRLAGRLRYICDFNEATLLRIMPRYGLPESEMKQLIHNACQGTRANTIPNDLQQILHKLESIQDFADGDDIADVETETKMPPLPPVIRQFVETAPDDFKRAVVLCQLPILGALGSKLRAKYIDGTMHSPSFQVSLEAPQASGKSFMRKLVDYELAQMLEHDEEQREKEREYDSKVRELKMLNMKVTVDNKDEILGSRPKSLIRFVPATMSITKLLMRMNDAQGLHLFAVAEEIDTITKAFKRGFSSYSDLLRVAFDNALYGQDYASENSFSGIIPIYYNLLTSGTPKAMRRFYPDVEDGLVSRVLFVTLPDQFGKRMPVWKELDEKQKAIVDTGLVRLNDISIQGDNVQPDHEMKLEWLNKEMQNWVLSQQAAALKEDDRTRDIFCRRASVVGFRAGMLAWFLYGEKNTPTIRKNVVRFATWVANEMLTQHLLRYNVNNTTSNINQWEDVYRMLGDEFTREELEKALAVTNHDSIPRLVIAKWKMARFIEVIDARKARKEKKYERYKKISK